MSIFDFIKMSPFDYLGTTFPKFLDIPRRPWFYEKKASLKLTDKEDPWPSKSNSQRNNSKLF